MSHPFDRYGPVTDLSALMEWSEKPLQKAIRVNTLKTSVEEVQNWAAEKGWQLRPIPWIAEGFWVDREDRSKPLGKDLLHLLGHIYMQEAASMLPVALLDPQPGELILDMSAAPGSKTTQIAARLQSEGIVVANDMQEKRLHTLVDALHRLGVLNAIVTKRAGQWFAHHMPERFHRVLIDAPCTAQGTSRKDSSALTYSSEMSIGKMAKLQHDLLESAIHSTKIGGRIVYSTCTLTPEENEQVILDILNKFSDQVTAVPVEQIPFAKPDLQQAIADSNLVQKKMIGIDAKLPCIRLWPQTYNTEGFFCAVLEKKAPTCDKERMEWVHRREKPLPRSRQKEIVSYIQDQFGAELIHDGETIVEYEDKLFLSTENSATLPLPLANFAQGIPLGKRVRDVPVLLDHFFLTLRGSEAVHSTVELTEDELVEFTSGADLSCDTALTGQTIVNFDGMCVGSGKARKGALKNSLPRWMVQMS